MKFNENERWNYHNTDKNSLNTYLIIQKLELDMNIVHISVKNISINNDVTDIDHLPISYDALIQSVTEQLQQLPATSSNDKIDFYQGYMEWKENNGGCWDIPLKAIIEHIKNTIDEDEIYS